jgi:murein DD-endopeptidase MepM/ murein hydrolase activator NlpD
MIVAALALAVAGAPLLDVQWDDATARTGKILIVDVAVAAGVAPIDDLAVTLDEHRGVFFFVSDDRRRARALLPVFIDRKPGKAMLTVDATLDGGEFTRWQKPVAIRAGAYDKRSITVGKQFTSPSKAQQARADEESKSLTAALATHSADRLWHGSFVTPTPGEMTSPFGTLRTYNKKRKSRHLGLDLDGDVGAPIVAANRGRVLLAMERFYSGGTVVLDHGQGLITMYFHMSRIDVGDGQLVERGAPLGAVGASGQVTGPHLHFSVRLDGLYVDPRQLLALKLDHDIAEQARRRVAAENGQPSTESARVSTEAAQGAPRAATP